MLSEAKRIRGQFVERKPCGVLDDHRGTFNVGVLCLDLVADQFTLANLRTPSRVLILNVNHAGVKVLEVCKGKHGCVFDQFQSEGHFSGWKSDGSGQLETLVLHEGAFGAEPRDADGVEFTVARGRNLFRLHGDTGLGDVVNLRNTRPSVS